MCLRSLESEVHKGVVHALAQAVQAQPEQHGQNDRADPRALEPPVQIRRQRRRAQQTEDEEHAVGLAVLEKIERVGRRRARKQREQAAEIRTELPEVRHGEHRPRHRDKHEHIQMTEHRPAVKILLEPELFHDQHREQPQTPEQEVQVRAVPEAGRKPDDEEVEDHALAAAVAAAERDIQILAEPRAERDVPAAPELRHAQRQIRAAEVLRDVEAQHPADADGHERVAPEVKIELERIRERGHPRKRRREALKADGGHISPEAAELVGKQNLERHAEHEQLEPVDRLTQRHIARAKLRLQLRIARDRAGDQLREHGQVRAEREQ